MEPSQSKASRKNSPFGSSRPPFSGDYHRFSSGVVAGRVIEEGVVVRTPRALKRKSGTLRREWDPTEKNAGPSPVAKAPLQTPPSVNSGKAQKGPRAKNAVKSQIMFGNDGSPGGSNLTPTAPSRYDSSLGFLTKKFVNLIKHAEEGVIDLTKAAITLEVQKRRIYDITNVLEGIGLVEKTVKNRIHWKAENVAGPGEDGETFSSLQEKVKNLKLEGNSLDERIGQMQEKIRTLSEDENNKKWLFLTEEDIKSLPGLQDETLIAIKAPHGSTLEVPDPEEDVDYRQRRYRMVVRSTMGCIHVYLVSKFEERLENADASEEAPSAHDAAAANNNACPLQVEHVIGTQIDTSVIEPQRRNSDAITSLHHESADGIVEIVPEVNNSEDYWLLTDAEGDRSLTDVWADLDTFDWSGLDLDLSMDGIGSPRTETLQPPSSLHSDIQDQNSSPPGTTPVPLDKSTSPKV